MANSLAGPIIHIDSFSSAVDLSTQYPGGMRIHSIEWAQPKGTTHTMTVLTGGKSGVTIFHEQCVTALQSIIKYFYKEWCAAPYIKISSASASGTSNASGAVIICRGT